MKVLLPFITFLLFFQVMGSSQSQTFLIDDISISGNKKTKINTILRELPFQKSNSISPADTAKLKFKAIQNLNNTLLFNFIELNFFLDTTSFKCKIQIVVDERWYLWPGLTFQLAETNINSWWQNKDFNRINIGGLIEWYNTSGRRDKLTIDVQGGWTRKLGINYYLPNLSKSQKFGITLDAFYANNQEINYTSINNERIFFKDQNFIQQEISGISTLEYRPKLFNTHSLSVGYKAVILNDTVLDLTATYLPENNLQSRFIHLKYQFRREKRDNRSYPLKGYLISAGIEQNGIGLIRENDISLGTINFTTNWHHHIHKRLYYAHGLKGKYTYTGEPPYYFQRGLGYDNVFIRGYELFVIDGQHFGLFKTNLKYQIIKKTVVDMKMPFIDKFDKFHYSLYLNAFGDAGYVADNINAAANPLANNFQYAYGLGLDFVSYYDIVIRFEGSINRQGTPGFFIHISNPI